MTFAYDFIINIDMLILIAYIKILFVKYKNYYVHHY